MPTFRDFHLEEVDGKYIEKPLLVTIALEEYRSLVTENVTLQDRVNYLEMRLLEGTEKRQKEGADNG